MQDFFWPIHSKGSETRRTKVTSIESMFLGSVRNWSLPGKGQMKLSRGRAEQFGRTCWCSVGNYLLGVANEPRDSKKHIGDVFVSFSVSPSLMSRLSNQQENWAPKMGTTFSRNPFPTAKSCSNQSPDDVEPLPRRWMLNFVRSTNTNTRVFRIELCFLEYNLFNTRKTHVGVNMWTLLVRWGKGSRSMFRQAFFDRQADPLKGFRQTFRRFLLDMSALDVFCQMLVSKRAARGWPKFADLVRASGMANVDPLLINPGFAGD